MTDIKSRVVVDNNGCWLWQGAIKPNGYGRIGDGYAHRVSYEQYVGPIPAGLPLDHLCRVRHCVNPEHLEPVTYSENTRRGDTLPAVNALKTHCVNGHEFNEKNTYLKFRADRVNPRRCCRECDRIAHATRYDKKRKKPRYV